jgi:hypothetical protein
MYIITETNGTVNYCSLAEWRELDVCAIMRDCLSVDSVVYCSEIGE